MRNSLFVLAGLALGFTAASSFTSREFTVLVTRGASRRMCSACTWEAPAAQIIGDAAVGLNEKAAEGFASHLNEIFAREKLEWSAVAVVQSTNVERSKPIPASNPQEAK